MTKHNAVTFFLTGILLSLACVLLVEAPGGRFRAHRIRVTEMRDLSGRHLAGFFEGLRDAPKYDLKKITEVNALANASACGGTRRNAWDRLWGVFGPISVQADQYCPGSLCGGYYYGPGTFACVPPNCNGVFALASYNPSLFPYDQGNQQTAKDAGNVPAAQKDQGTTDPAAVPPCRARTGLAWTAAMTTTRSAAVLGTSAMGAAVHPNRYVRAASLPLISLAIPIRTAMVPTSAWGIAVPSAVARRVTTANTPALTDTAKNQAPSLST